MHFVRRSTYHFVSCLFFIFLVLTAWSITTTVTFSNPDRLESWLSESKLYDNFVATALEQVQKSTEHPADHSTDNGISLSLSDPGVQAAVKQAFTPQVLQSAVNTFINANYDWLNGKTTTPNFTIDLTAAKAALGTNIGNYVQAKLGSLPQCTTTVKVDENFDALSATCLPRGVDPASEGHKAQQQLTNNQAFLANPVITPQSFNQASGQGDQQSKPYYEKLSQLPRAYRLATKIPWIVSTLAVLCGAALIFLAATKRTGLRRVAALFVSSGVTILLLIALSKAVLSSLEHHAFKNDAVGQLQLSLTNFAHRAQSSLVKVDLWFGIGFIVAGIIVYLLLKFVWPVTPKAPEAEPTPAITTKPKTPTLIQL